LPIHFIAIYILFEKIEKYTFFCSVDATQDSKRLGRLVNHSKANANLKTEILEYNKQPRLVLFAKKEILIGEELLFDYGYQSHVSVFEFQRSTCFYF
jgi:SET domain-containing protein